MKTELEKCKNDIVYFIENYCQRKDAGGNYHPIKLYSWQKEMIKENFIIKNKETHQASIPFVSINKK